MSEERSVWSGGSPVLARLESCALTFQLENPKAASSLSELTSFGAHKAPDDARLERRLEKLQRRRGCGVRTGGKNTRDTSMMPLFWEAAARRGGASEELRDAIAVGEAVCAQAPYLSVIVVDGAG